MTYIHVNCINLDDLEDDEQALWLERQVGEDFFVPLTAGDESFHEAIRCIGLTLEDVIEDCQPGESIIFPGEAPKISGFNWSVSYWGDEMLTKAD